MMDRTLAAILICLIIIYLLTPPEILGLIILASLGYLMGSHKVFNGGAPLTPEQEQILDLVQKAYLADPANYYEADMVYKLCRDGEEKIADMTDDIDARLKLRHKLTGEVDYLMADDEINQILTDTLKRWRSEGVLVAESEFVVDPAQYHLQRSLYPEMGADVTRIFGAEYLSGIFTRDNVDNLAVPKYKLVVPDLSNVVCWISSRNESHNGNSEGLVWRGVTGVLYAEKITGVPSIAGLMKEVAKVVEVSRFNGSWPRTDIYPRGDYIRSLANSLYSDYGVGIGANATGDNAILMNDKYYFIDTELKSFALRFTRTPLEDYMSIRFKALRGRPVFDQAVLSYSITLPS